MKIRKEKHLAKILITLIVIMFFSSSLYAADQWLSEIANVKSPHRIAVTPTGDLLVTKAAAARMYMFDGAGNSLGAVAVTQSVSLDVGPDGRIYVGHGKYSTNTPPYDEPGEVKVYDASLNYLFSLGAGKGEFINPVDIKAASNGLIYVADSSANRIKVFNADGTLAVEFGEQGAGDDKLNIPLAIDVDEVTGEIYIADRNIIMNSDGTGSVIGARVKVFDSNGTALVQKAFGVYDVGDLISPSDITLYSGKLFITDSYLNVIQVYDVSTGTLVETLRDPGDSIRMPSSVDISPNGKLYVTSTNTDTVQVIGLEGYSDFTLSPNNIDISVYTGQVIDGLADVTIENTGSIVVNWTASAGECLTVTPSGSVDAGASGVATIGADTSACAEGTYSSTVSVSDQNGISQTVTVNLTVLPAPMLSSDVDSLTFAADVNGSDPQSQGLIISLANAPDGSNWLAANNEGWLSVNPVQAGAGDTPVTASVSIGGLVPGTYTDVITVSSTVVADAVSITVQLTVNNTTTIAVETNLDGASFVIEGPGGASYQGEGTSWTMGGVPPGQYRVVYGDVPGYVTPQDETSTVTMGGLLTFTGTYEAQKAMNIVASAVSGKGSNVIKVLKGSGDIALALKADGRGFDNAVGDVDGDGDDEIILSSQGHQSVVTILGLKEGDTTFRAFTGDEGVSVCAADLDGNGDAELIVASAGHKAMVKVFDYVNGNIVDTGAALKEGSMLLTAANIDDKKSGIVMIGGGNHPFMLTCTVDAAGGDGNWTINCANKLPVDRNIDAISAADLDGDGVDEIIGVIRRNIVSLDPKTGAVTVLFKANGSIGDLAAADVNGDGYLEIVAGEKGGVLSIYRSDGTELNQIQLYKNGSGVRVSLGVLGY